MPSSLIIVALVVAWLVVLVPMIVRKRQEIARTADSALAARVVRCAEEAEEEPMRDAEPVDETTSPEQAAPPPSDDPFAEAPRRYRPGRGGFDPETAAVIARAKYSFRQRVVLAMLVGAVLSAIGAVVVSPLLWWGHGILDLGLVAYLGYLRRQVRIELEIRERRLARMRAQQRIRARTHAHPLPAEEPAAEPEPAPQRQLAVDVPPPPRRNYPGATIVEVDDEDPAFDELAHPDNLPYRRAVGE